MSELDIKVSDKSLYYIDRNEKLIGNKHFIQVILYQANNIVDIFYVEDVNEIDNRVTQIIRREKIKVLNAK